MLHGAGTDKVFTSLLGFEVLTLHAARLLVWRFLPHQKNSNSSQDLGTDNHIPSSPFVVSAISVRVVSGCKRIFLRNPLMLSLPSLVFLPSLCVFGLTEMDPQWDANFAEVHSKLYDEIMSSIHLVFAHFSDGVRGLPAERLGQAMRILGMNPTEDQDLWPQIEAFVEVLMRKSHLPGPPCDSLVMFGPLNCLRFELPQGLQTLGRSWSPIHRPSDVSPFHPGQPDQSDSSGMVQFLILREVDVSFV